ncbi:CopG family transcriptional regulator [Pseudanabaena sp. UWO310]|uniref:CopG family transcriptional regulator n=1 Tax=Pseudanabaena sp. UWO310 TaxID=2480795 RepID=UPI00115BB4D7|nr:CopG family transcriptional regulator [Pseudanabaena sp. UWO310]TYQ26563.1 CopG family transcriptional regulator [Pseudanabaena sp. UWO310]
MAAQINAVLDDEHTAKLAYIQQQTQESEIETIKQAIAFYYQYLQEQKRDPTFLLKQSGFIGCGDGDRNLSTNYKAALKTILEGN